MLSRILSLDIETYGKAQGPSFPEQTCFSPARALWVDRPPHPILCVSLTRCTLDPLPCDTTSCSSLTSPTTNSQPSTLCLQVNGTGNTSTSVSQGGSIRTTESTLKSSVSIASTLATLRPVETLVLPFAPLARLLPARHSDDSLPSGLDVSALETSLRMTPSHAERVLLQWLTWADTLCGMNLAFDLGWLRTRPLLRSILDARHLILDLSVFNYLESENRPERSLKNLGPVLGTHTYADPEEKTHRYKSSLALLHYCACDTHNTVLALQALSARVSRQPPSAKLSPLCLTHYSDTIWCCVEMAEAGVPFDRPRLERLATRLTRHIATCERLCSTLFSLPLSGTGSKAPKDAFILSLLDAVQREHFDELKQYDPKTDTFIPTGKWRLKPGHSIPELPPYATHMRDHPLLQFTPITKQLSFCDANRSLLTSLLPRTHPLQRPARLVGRHARAQKLLGTYCFPYLWHKRTDPTHRKSTLTPPTWSPGDPLPCPATSAKEETVPTPKKSRGTPHSLEEASVPRAKRKPTRKPKWKTDESPGLSGDAPAVVGKPPPTTAPTAAPPAPT